MPIVLLETASNQNFIFATNKLRENVGASELTFRAGTQFVLDAVHQSGGPDLWPRFPESLLDAAANPPLATSRFPVEVLLATSGKALLLVRTEEVGRHIVHTATLRALKEAPGLDLRGVVTPAFDFATTPIHGQIKHAHQLLEQLRPRIPGPAARFQRLPILAECATSGLPAAAFDRSLTVAAERGPRSHQSLAKQRTTQDGLGRIRRLVRGIGRLPAATTELEDLGCDWLAVAHADGNGLGKVFLAFDQHAQAIGAANNRVYIDRLRSFSLALDGCTETAFRGALAQLRPRGRREVLPVVPLVLGGDDFTAILDGRQAMNFVQRFLVGFEKATANEKAITTVMPGGTTTCAGVAIIKPHFPFHAAYELAEQLLKSAKKAKPLSAIDFHVLYDASGPDLRRLRGELLTDAGRTSLVARPYVLRPDTAYPQRAWDDLAARIAALRARDDDGRPRLPRGMLHELREGLFFGHTTAEARLQLVRERYRAAGLERLLVGASLFWPAGEQRVTGLLDALDLAEFWEGAES